MINETYILTRNCPATLIPAGDQVILEKGTAATVTQALGSSVTVTTRLGMFRIDGPEVEALGEDAASQFGQLVQEQPEIDPTQPLTESMIWDALRNCFDPEIPVNIVDLGLIYDLQIKPESDGRNRVDVKMTLTAQGCGMGPSIAADAKHSIETLPQVSEASVEIVWEPAWNPKMISEQGRKKLGLD